MVRSRSQFRFCYEIQFRLVVIVINDLPCTTWTATRLKRIDILDALPG